MVNPVVYERNLYLDRIRPFLGKPVVKVLTGMRRSGKSCLVRLLIEKLVAEGTPHDRIVYVDKESYAFDAICTYHDLAGHVETARLKSQGMLHIFVDVQVAYLLPTVATLEREVAPLLSVKDNYPKLLLTLDRELGNDIRGVRRLYLPDWLEQGDRGD